MSKSMVLMSFAALVALSACGSSTDEQKMWLSPDDDMVDIQNAINELENLVIDAYDESGGFFRKYDERPAGQATYSGLMLGEPAADSGPDLFYAANLSLNVDFESEAVSGTVSNVLTTLEGFDRPQGSIPIEGGLGADAFGDARIAFDGQGTLTQGSNTATYIIPEAWGWFGGNDFQATDGYQATNFVWTSGPFDGTNSSSDGYFMAVTN